MASLKDRIEKAAGEIENSLKDLRSVGQETDLGDVAVVASRIATVADGLASVFGELDAKLSGKSSDETAKK